MIKLLHKSPMFLLITIFAFVRLPTVEGKCTVSRDYLIISYHHRYYIISKHKGQ